MHGLFEEPCSVLAERMRNVQVLIELSVNGSAVNPRSVYLHKGVTAPSAYQEVTPADKQRVAVGRRACSPVICCRDRPGEDDLFP